MAPGILPGPWLAGRYIEGMSLPARLRGQRDRPPAPAPSKAPMMKLQLNGLTTNYELHGPEGAPWLVLSHSLAYSSAMWAPQVEALKGDYRILAYDTRGHGGTEAPPGPYTLEQLADDLHALLGALGVERPHYCGLSMGGMIGQTYALKYPGRLRSLTLADTTSRYPAEAAAVWAQRI